jgi:tryprostatin B 6-hydroxylase
LDGVIWEALRLFPPNPSHPSRVTPAGGVTIAGRFVPGGTQVITPHWVLGRGKSLLSLLLRIQVVLIGISR